MMGMGRGARWSLMMMMMMMMKGSADYALTAVHMKAGRVGVQFIYM